MNLIDQIYAWASNYDDPDKAYIAMEKLMKHIQPFEAQRIVAERLDGYFTRIAQKKTKLRVTAIEYDITSIIESILCKEGWLRRSIANEVPIMENTEDSVDYGELTPEEYESLSDPGPDITDRH